MNNIDLLNKDIIEVFKFFCCTVESTDLYQSGSPKSITCSTLNSPDLIITALCAQLQEQCKIYYESYRIFRDTYHTHSITINFVELPHGYKSANTSNSEEQIECSHPNKKVVHISSANAFLYCPDCKKDLGDYKE